MRHVQVESLDDGVSPLGLRLSAQGEVCSFGLGEGGDDLVQLLLCRVGAVKLGDGGGNTDGHGDSGRERLGLLAPSDRDTLDPLSVDDSVHNFESVHLLVVQECLVVFVLRQFAQGPEVCAFRQETDGNQLLECSVVVPFGNSCASEIADGKVGLNLEPQPGVRYVVEGLLSLAVEEERGVVGADSLIEVSVALHDVEKRSRSHALCLKGITHAAAFCIRHEGSEPGGNAFDRPDCLLGAHLYSACSCEGLEGCLELLRTIRHRLEDLLQHGDVLRDLLGLHPACRSDGVDHVRLVPAVRHQLSDILALCEARLCCVDIVSRALLQSPELLRLVNRRCPLVRLLTDQVRLHGPSLGVLLIFGVPCHVVPVSLLGQVFHLLVHVRLCDCSLRNLLGVLSPHSEVLSKRDVFVVIACILQLDHLGEFLHVPLLVGQLSELLANLVRQLRVFVERGRGKEETCPVHVPKRTRRIPHELLRPSIGILDLHPPRPRVTQPNPPLNVRVLRNVLRVHQLLGTRNLVCLPRG
mmetsp:Transcript_21383/g.42457  ORF Transcript_21383/g.42457 Transcript_21383/m.42457 type:complete len:525 (-) Transcript_21383:394-1968(-)